MSQQELVRRVAGALDGAGIAHMLTGSLVSSLQGEPRATHDVDVVIQLDESAVGALVGALAGPGVYLDPEAVAEAVRSQGMFNLVDEGSGDKVDFWMLTGDSFDQARFSRRVRVHVLGVDVPVSTPEDTILMKLRWARASGGSEKQYTDALRVYEVQLGALDEGYLDGWADRLEVVTLLARLRSEAETEI